MSDALDEIRADPRVTAIRTLRTDNATRARKAQEDHRRHTRTFVLATSVAAIAGALVLYGAGGESQVPPSDFSQRLYTWLAAGPLRLTLFVVQVACLGLAAYAGYKLRGIGSGGDWLRERRAAEIGRADLYDEIMKVGRERGPEFERAAFADFLGTQLDGQIDFYVRAEARHSGEARRTATLGAAAAALVAAGGATAGASGIGGEIWIAVAAGIGVVAPILVNAVRSWQEATLDREKAERYRTASETLIRLKAESGEAMRALTAGDPEPARSLVVRVHNVMREENGAWIPARGPV